MQLISDKTLRDIEESIGLDLFGEKEKASAMKKIVTLISGRAGLRIMKQFSEEEAKEFNKIPEENLEEMENYIISKNAKDIFEEEATKMKEEILKMKI
jgi:hypothetical protein